ncbi:hypothetical protein DFJ74DRAFT_312128 [Hyaloraphidium curvatum]|nr:hypothetical protein DFJ74DRAFT_312128 [Hyaloraphidium curvatum]
MAAPDDAPAALASFLESSFPTAVVGRGALLAAASPRGGLGLFAASAHAKGAVLLRIPAKATLSTSNILEASPEVERTLAYLQEDAGWRLSERTVVAVALLRLRALRASGDAEDPLERTYGAYVDAMPVDLAAHPAAWLASQLGASGGSESEERAEPQSNSPASLLERAHPPLHTALSSKLRTLAREHASAAAIFAAHLLPSSAEPAFADWLAADLLYVTRALALGDAIEAIQLAPGVTEDGDPRAWASVRVMEDVDRYHMVPLLDFANHAPAGEANARWRPALEGREVFVELVAARGLEEGEEVTISYATAASSPPADGSADDEPWKARHLAAAAEEELLFAHGIPASSSPAMSAAIQLIPPSLDADLPSELPALLGILEIKGRGVVRADAPAAGSGGDLLAAVFPDPAHRAAALLIHGLLTGARGSEVDISPPAVTIPGHGAFRTPGDLPALLAALESDAEIVSAARDGLRALVAVEVEAAGDAIADPGWKGVPEVVRAAAEGRLEVLQRVAAAFA